MQYLCSIVVGRQSLDTQGRNRKTPHQQVTHVPCENKEQAKAMSELFVENNTDWTISSHVSVRVHTYTGSIVFELELLRDVCRTFLEDDDDFALFCAKERKLYEGTIELTPSRGPPYKVAE